MDDIQQKELLLPFPELSADLPLLPARMVNEYEYCPRLAYLEWLQGEWAESADTVEGRYRHRRVDKSAGDLPALGETEEGEKIHAKSITLSSNRLGLIAKLDLVEGDGSMVTRWSAGSDSAGVLVYSAANRGGLIEATRKPKIPTRTPVAPAPRSGRGLKPCRIGGMLAAGDTPKTIFLKATLGLSLTILRRVWRTPTSWWVMNGLNRLYWILAREIASGHLKEAVKRADG